MDSSSYIKVDPARHQHTMPQLAGNAATSATGHGILKKIKLLKIMQFSENLFLNCLCGGLLTNLLTYSVEV
jgi:hypothetical protein